MMEELRESVQQWLNDLDDALCDRDDRVVAEVARCDVPALIDAMWQLLDAHRPDSSGYCTACASLPGRRWLPRKRPTVPCHQYLSARRTLLGEPAEGRHAVR